VFALWLLGTLIIGAYFINSRLVEFDPDNKLTGEESDLVIQQMMHIDGLENVDLSHTIIHFTGDNCACDAFSENHKREIDQRAKLEGFKVLNIHLAKNSTSIIPSTPAILIVGKMKELLYLGPYSVGLACSQSNGYVETILNNYAKGFRSELIVNKAEGCYCHL